MTFLERNYTSQDAAKASAMDSKFIQNAAARGLIVGHGGGGGKGYARLFSWSNVMEIALAGELMEVGLKAPADAFAAAQRFAHASSGGSGWAGDYSEVRPIRLPGLPYHYELGTTYLFVSGSRSTVELGTTTSVDFGAVLPRLGDPATFLTLDLSRIFMRMAQRLGMDFRTALDEAYQGSRVRQFAGKV